MTDALLFVGLPYVALFVLVAGTIWRFRASRYSVSALSSQMLEDRALLFGTVPWHIGILILFAGHLVAFLVPGLWAAVVSVRPVLLAVEALGLAAAALAAFGLVLLIIRRVIGARLQAVTTWMDLVILGLLLGQVLLGIGVAVGHRFGAAWSTGTTTPYLWSLLTLHPDMALVADLPAVVRFHLVGAFLIFLLVPFSRLVHAVTLPLDYLFRAPQRVVWTTRRRLETLAATPTGDPDAVRRHLLRGVVGIVAGGALVSLGVADRLFSFFRGQDLSRAAEAKLLAERLERLHATTEQATLELERLRSDYIPVAHLGELSKTTGKYFIDYRMRPALAFLDGDGLPVLWSAKCTHLGCTVGNQVDAKGLLLCPCHLSYFSVRDGVPLPGAPAKAPLPRLGWVVLDPAGEVVASQDPSGHTEGTLDPKKRDSYRVFIARKYSEEPA